MPRRKTKRHPEACKPRRPARGRQSAALFDPAGGLDAKIRRPHLDAGTVVLALRDEQRLSVLSRTLQLVGFCHREPPVLLHPSADEILEGVARAGKVPPEVALHGYLVAVLVARAATPLCHGNLVTGGEAVRGQMCPVARHIGLRGVDAARALDGRSPQPVHWLEAPHLIRHTGVRPPHTLERRGAAGRELERPRSRTDLNTQAPVRLQTRG